MIRDYDSAVDALNGLQSNSAQLAEQRASGGRDLAAGLAAARACLARVGVTDVDMARLNAVHIAGSKGKGSAAAMTEALFRERGLKTGLYTSPHLMEVRERIRVGERSLSRELFAKYFWECWDALRATEGGMPPYFRFLTVMAFKVFVAEAVDVAVLEVGIGGRFDATNLCRPRVCGITSLALEHTDLLGPTLADIAFHKGGIIKPGVPVFTVPQPEAALAVLREIAAEEHAPLRVVPPLAAYPPPPAGALAPRLPGAHQHANASLALQLAHAWGQNMSRPHRRHADADADGGGGGAQEAAPPVPVADADRRALLHVRWPGRSQTLRRGRVTWLLDGAHTAESCAVCAAWARSQFAAASSASGGGGGGATAVVRVLWFNLSGPRDPAALMRPLAALAAEFPYAHALFSPNVSTFKDMANAMVAADTQRATSRMCRDAWLALRPPADLATVALADSIDEAYRILMEGLVPQHPDAQIEVLVTGSLHLVGGVLKLLEYDEDAELE